MLSRPCCADRVSHDGTSAVFIRATGSGGAHFLSSRHLSARTTSDVTALELIDLKLWFLSKLYLISRMMSLQCAMGTHYRTSTNAFRFCQSFAIESSSHSDSSLARRTDISRQLPISEIVSGNPPALCSTQSVGDVLDVRCVSARVTVEGINVVSRCVGSTNGCSLKNTRVSRAGQAQGVTPPRTCLQRMQA